jgi:hypothetical protein
MHTIYMGDICLLKAEMMASAGQGPAKYRDLSYGATVSDTNSLASLFGAADFEALKAVGTLPLKIFNGRSRSFEIIFDESGADPEVVVKDEVGSTFDFHEITVADLFKQPAFAEI